MCKNIRLCAFLSIISGSLFLASSFQQYLSILRVSPCFRRRSPTLSFCYQTSTSLQMSKLIRLQNSPDPCLHNITNLADIQAKIKSARDIQNKYRDADLYKQSWIPSHLSKNIGRDDVFIRDLTFKVMQFNTLAEGLSVGPRTPPPFDRVATDKVNKVKSVYGGFSAIPSPEISLNFSLRQWRLMEVLLRNDKEFDVIALEEIDRFHGFFEPLLKLVGYEGLFIPKPYSPGVQSGWYSDGCAFFWKRGVFELHKEEKGTFDIGNQVYIIATMKHVPSQHFFVFGMTHLKAGKDSAMENIRTPQVKQLLRNTDRAALSAAVELNISLTSIPIILLGDFNSDLREKESCVSTVISNRKCNMTSVYKLDPPTENFFSTWKTRGASTSRRIIDYIFYSSSRGVECTHILDVPSEVMEESLLPGFKYPSDHLAIGAIFKIDDPNC